MVSMSFGIVPLPGVVCALMLFFIYLPWHFAGSMITSESQLNIVGVSRSEQSSNGWVAKAWA